MADPAKPEAVRDHGPAEWLIPFLETRYTRIAKKPRAEAAQRQLDEEVEAHERATVEARGTQPAERESEGDGFRSAFQPGRREDILATDMPLSYWHDRLAEYRKRQAAARKGTPAVNLEHLDFERAAPPAPGIIGANNWVPIGPSVVRRGQPSGRPAISGRASGIAIAPGSTRHYVATADGGVWRSGDTGRTWFSTMDAFDVNPTAFAATSLACGAIAIAESNPDRVYVGTGEGDTNALFASRLTQALPSYRGVGPLRSDNGGALWMSEPTAPASPTLFGAAFYALAVDPGNQERVVAATNIGLYRREPTGSGGFHWVQKRAGVHSHVVVARSGSTTTFFAAAWGDKVYSSHNGNTWSAAGSGFATAVNRIGLAVRRTNPNVLYALVADTSNALNGVYRLDNAT